jgi:hypothetical protein
LFVFLIFDKKRLSHRVYFLVADLALFFTYIAWITLFAEFPYYVYYMFPLALLGLLCYILSENKDKNLFVFLWIFGIFYLVCLEIASDSGFIVSNMGMLISNLASAVFIKNCIDELRKQKEYKYKRQNESKFGINQGLIRKLLVPALTVALLLQIAQEFYLDANLKFNPEYLISNPQASWGASRQKDSKEKLNVILQTGPEKGIKTTAFYAKVYNGILSDLAKIKENGSGPVYIAALFPFGYLYLDMPYATGSTWCISYNFRAEKQRLLDYYELHPDKIAKYIYLPKMYEVIYKDAPERTKEKLKLLSENFDYTSQESDYGYTLKITDFHMS